MAAQARAQRAQCGRARGGGARSRRAAETCASRAAAGAQAPPHSAWSGQWSVALPMATPPSLAKPFLCISLSPSTARGYTANLLGDALIDANCFRLAGKLSFRSGHSVLHDLVSSLESAVKARAT